MKFFGLVLGGLVVVGCGARSEFEDAVVRAGAGGKGGGGSGGLGPAVASSSSTTTGAGASGGGGAGGSGGIDLLISQSSESFLEAETDVAVSAKGRVAAAWIADGFDGHSFIGAAFSDGGASWSQPLHVDTPEGKDASDPVLAVDAAGQFYLAWIGFHRDAKGNPIDTSVYVARAPANAQSFGPAVAIGPAGENDKPWIAVTPGGAVLVTWINFDAGETRLRSARSANGVDFTLGLADHDVTGTKFFQHARPCTAAGSKRVWLSYTILTLNAGNSALLTYSDDDGASWHSPALVLSKTKDVAHTDTACFAAGSEVWAMFGLSNDPLSETANPILTGVRVAHSSDGGQTEDGLFTVQDGSNQPVLLPQMVGGGPGDLHLDYYRGMAVDDPAGAMVELAIDRANGKPLSSKVLRQPIVFQNKRDSTLWLGDYTGLRVAGGITYATFADNAVDGKSHIRFIRSP